MRIAIWNVAGAMAVGVAVAMSVQAGEVKGPASVDESAPQKTGKDAKDAKGKASSPAMPSKGPASVSESAPQKTGKEPPAPMAKGDSKNMPNPKTPSSVSESAPSKAADADKKDRKKRSDKDTFK